LDVISLFSGAGGMDLGVTQAGHKIIWASDKSINACATYERNLHLKPVHQDITRITQFPKAEVVIGCNPCQGFSFIGARNVEDRRNYLYKDIIRCLKQVQPKFFVTENVRGLKYLYQGRFLQLMLSEFDHANYNVTCDLLNAKNYGVPQDRERIFMVGIRKDLGFKYNFPEKTHGPGLKPYVTLRQTIGDLAPPKENEYWRDSCFPFFYMSRNRRRSWNEVSYTIQASGRHAPLHPSSPPMKHVGKDTWVFEGKASQYRRLSARECARIQTFPDHFQFLGSLGSQYQQIGNAVPPLLAYKVALALNSLESDEKRVAVSASCV
jgi:DNA (cytosine-5)-methyltransferase 1